MLAAPGQRHAYRKILKSKGADFDRDFIYSGHWSKGKRETIEDVPDLSCKADFSNRKATKKTTQVRKLESAKRHAKQQRLEGSKVQKKEEFCYKSADQPSKEEILQKEIDDLKARMIAKTNEAHQLSDLVKDLEIQNETYQFQLKLFAYIIPATIYPDSKTYQQRKLTKRTELLCFMTICRHTLHLGIVGYMTITSASTHSRIFTA